MPPTVPEFVRHLVASKLMTREQVNAFLAELPDGERPQDGEALARRLIRHGKLTLFQANAVFQGRAHGLVLGDYVLLDRIGAGGMGQVFKAMHHRMERVVALKVLSPKMTSSPDAIHRFEREMKAAARLSHPNIVTAFDARHDDGVIYLVMEYVDGIDLSRLVREKGPLAVETAVDYIVQTARGLAHAHAAGIVHRDIKPANLLLDKSGTVKILDMGLARLRQPENAAKKPGDSGNTDDENIVGTVDYMSPEQAFDPRDTSPTSDIYSLGCTLYYLLTGKTIYDGDTIMSRILAHREAPIPQFRKHRKGVPDSVETVFRKMVAKEAKDRYQSMNDVIAALGGTNAPRGTTAAASSGDDTLPQDVMKAIFDD